MSKEAAALFITAIGAIWVTILVVGAWSRERIARAKRTAYGTRAAYYCPHCVGVDGLSMPEMEGQGENGRSPYA